MRLKKRFCVCALLVMLLSIIANTTFAYYTAAETASNVITSAGIDIELVETTKDGEPFRDVENVMPGDTVSKIVQVNNLQEPAYVRIRCDAVITDANGEPLDLTAIPDSAEAITIDFNWDGWALGEDGYYYYKQPVASGAVTTPLFTQVTFSADKLGNEFQNTTLTITIQAQATQVANNGTNYAEAAGWPNA